MYGPNMPKLAKLQNILKSSGTKSVLTVLITIALIAIVSIGKPSKYQFSWPRKSSLTTKYKKSQPQINDHGIS